MLAAPLLARTDGVVTIDDAALRTGLLIAATPAQLRQEQAGLLIGHGRDPLQGERYGLGRKPELGGHCCVVTVVGMQTVYEARGSWDELDTRYNFHYRVLILYRCTLDKYIDYQAIVL